MKKLVAFLIVSILILTLSACDDIFIKNRVNQQTTDSSSYSSNKSTPSSDNLQQSNQTTIITREEALEIALKEANLKQTDIYNLDIELDNEHGGVSIWEVDFDCGNLEYSYDINAKTGSITKAEKERD